MGICENNAEAMMQVVKNLIQAITHYDKNFDFEKDEQHDCVLAGYRDTAFGILLTLFMMGKISSGDFHRAIFDMNKAIYKKIR